ncbi:glycine cleavage system H protein [Fusarium austroafricanum]|uniref:Glycine cleavage system H protein n=1 Tax=Fusarium austroafricanum TaxID=2364996 RepID=A0A8H4P3Z5_9HYPO|nr:glycine cleavage system H protein [Fusarium austroafricanum]
MSGFFARQAWASASKLRSTALRAPKTAFTCQVNSIAPRRCFSVSMNILARKYTESHEWIDVASDGKTCTIGISNHAAEALGDIVYVELPASGEEVSEGESFGSVESVKSASDINSPVSGSVVAVNDPIAETPADLGNDPEGEGWLIKVEAEDVSALDSLMDEAAYAKHCEEH